MRTEWNTFKGGVWQREINVRDFIQKNYTPYDGSDEFLEGPTQNTTELWDQVMELSKQEQEAGGVLDMDTKIISTITSHGPGYLNKDRETIVGFQTDKPFKRSLQSYHHRTAGCLWTRTHNRGLPQGCPLRCGRPDSGEKGRKGFHTHHHVL